MGRLVLAWQSAVTTVKTELWWKVVSWKVLTHVTWRTLGRVWLSWQVWRVSSHCEQFIKYECYSSVLLRSRYGWLVSRDGTKMMYWGGATADSNKCACGMNNTCADPSRTCNCDNNDQVWREDSVLLTLPVSQLRFGDTDLLSEKESYPVGALGWVTRDYSTDHLFDTDIIFLEDSLTLFWFLVLVHCWNSLSTLKSEGNVK